MRYTLYGSCSEISWGGFSFLAIYAEKTLVSKLDEFRLNLTSCQAVKLTTDKLGKKAV